MPETAESLRVELRKVESMLKTFGCPKGDYLFGDKIHVADLTCLSMKTFMDDSTYNSQGSNTVMASKLGQRFFSKVVPTWPICPNLAK